MTFHILANCSLLNPWIDTLSEPIIHGFSSGIKAGLQSLDWPISGLSFCPKQLQGLSLCCDPVSQPDTEAAGSNSMGKEPFFHVLFGNLSMPGCLQRSALIARMMEGQSVVTLRQIPVYEMVEVLLCLWFRALSEPAQSLSHHLPPQSL